MAHYQNIYNGGNGAPPVAQAAPRMTDWSGEVTPMPADPPMPEAPGRTVTSAGRPMDRLNVAEEQGGQSMGSLDMRNHLPSEVITDPISMEEAYRGSLKAMLKKNVGNYVVATGIDTFLGVDPYVKGSSEVCELLTGEHGVKDWVEANYTVELDIDKLGDMMIERIEQKRAALGI